MKLGNLKTGTIQRTKSLLQGDPSAPWLFNHTLDRPLHKFHELCQREKYGYPIEDGKYYVCIFAFADNYWLVSTSPQEAKTMLGIWLATLREFGFNTPEDELTICTTAMDHEFTAPIVVNGVKIFRASRDTGFKALGAMITFNNSFRLDQDRRIAGAWIAFRKFAPLLESRHVALDTKFKMLQRGVHPALFWCAGSWNLRINQLEKLRGVQRAMVRRMLGFH